MSGKRVLALYAAVLLGFAVVLCRLYFLAENHTYAARAEAQSTVRLSLPARRGSFYDHSGLLLTGWKRGILPLLPGRKQLHTPVCIYGQCRAGTFVPEPQPLRTVSAGSGPRPFRARHTLLCNGTALRRSSAVQHLIGYLDAEGCGTAGLEKRWTASWPGQRSMTRWCARSQHKDGCGPGKHRSSPGRTAVRWACS